MCSNVVKKVVEYSNTYVLYKQDRRTVCCKVEVLDFDVTPNCLVQGGHVGTRDPISYE